MIIIDLAINLSLYLVDKAGVDPSVRCVISSKLKKWGKKSGLKNDRDECFDCRYDDKYTLTVQYNDGKDGSTGCSGVLFNSVGNYFDENGVLCYDRFTEDLKKIYDQTRSNARKVK